MSQAEGKLSGRWALITGGGKRIGACIARTLHDQGCSVAIHYRGSAREAQELADELARARPASAFTVQGDLLAGQEGLDRMVTQVVNQSGRLDILINNASTFYPTPVGKITEADWDDLLGTNLKAPLFLSQAAAPHLKTVGGVIINMVDIHARRPLRNHPVYGAAKAGLEMLTRSLAKDLAPDVRVNGVSPGAILWPEEGMPDQTAASIVRQVPLARVGDPMDIASCVLFLAVDATYVTGQVIAVDGGRSVGW